MENVRAYLVYGVQLPAECASGIGEFLEEFATRHSVSPGYLEAGRYDEDDLFLTTMGFEASTGSPSPISLRQFSREDFDRADSLLDQVVRELGIDGEYVPEWLLIADND